MASMFSQSLATYVMLGPFGKPLANSRVDSICSLFFFANTACTYCEFHLVTQFTGITFSGLLASCHTQKQTKENGRGSQEQK